MVTSGKHFNGGCCYDYGNGELSRHYEAGPTMDAIYFGNSTQFTGSGNGAGPWIMADMEDGMVAQGGGGKNDKLLSQTSTYVTAMEKNNGTTEFALKAADATKTGCRPISSIGTCFVSTGTVSGRAVTSATFTLCSTDGHTWI